MRSTYLPIIIVLFGLFSTVAQATSPTKPFSIHELTSLADLVFQGSVIDVRYKESKVQGSIKGIPHTFVTYRISTILSGEYKGTTLTLRFRGGLFNDGKSFSMPRHIPLFDVGNEDILFVKNNLSSDCPLIRCKAGRLRIHKGLIYNDEGAEILSVDALSSIQIGAQSNIPTFNQHKVGNTRLVKHKSQEPTTARSPSDTVMNEYDAAWASINNKTAAIKAKPVDINLVKRKIKAIKLSNKNTTTRKNNTSTVLSAKIEADFSIPAANADPKQLMLIDKR